MNSFKPTVVCIVQTQMHIPLFRSEVGTMTPSENIGLLHARSLGKELEIASSINGQRRPQWRWMPKAPCCLIARCHTQVHFFNKQFIAFLRYPSKSNIQRLTFIRIHTTNTQRKKFQIMFCGMFHLPLAVPVNYQRCWHGQASPAEICEESPPHCDTQSRDGRRLCECLGTKKGLTREKETGQWLVRANP